METVEVKIHGRSLLMTKVANIDELLDRISEPEEIPFWAELWPASIGLSQYILSHRSRFDRCSLLELGAGVGLAGITAKLAGATVTHSDYTPEAFRFIRVNSERNGTADGEMLLADWRRFPEGQRFEIIIGADILYEKNLHEALLDVFPKALKPGGTIYLADPGREWAKLFLERLAGLGWQVTMESIALEYRGQTFTINIYQIQPNGNHNE